jgi:hypothetical protein
MTARIIAKTAVAVSALVFSAVLANGQTVQGQTGSAPATSQGSAPSKAPATTSNQQTAPSSTSAPGTASPSASGDANRPNSTGRSTTGANAPSNTTDQPASASGQPGRANQPGTGAASGSSNNAAPGTSSTSSATASVVNLTEQQRTEIRQTVIHGGNAPRVSSVNFNIGVGVVVPQTVHFAPLPPTIVRIHPEWREYHYFVYADEIIIVEPGTRRIIAVLRV